MGFITHDGRNFMQAYLTPEGRELLVSGNPEKAKFRYFAVGDQDINYLQASQYRGDGYNAPLAGYLPDLSGDDAGMVRSVAAGVGLSSYLLGGENVGQLGTNRKIGGKLNEVSLTAAGVTRNVTFAPTPSLTQTVNLPVTVVGGVVGGEQVRAYVLPSGTSPEIYPYLSLNNSGVLTWAAGESATKRLDITLNFGPALPEAVALASTTGEVLTLKLTVLLVPFRSPVLVTVTGGSMVLDVFVAKTKTTTISTPPVRGGLGETVLS